MDIKRQTRRFFDGQMSQHEAEEFLSWIDSSASEEELSIFLDTQWEKSGSIAQGFNHSGIFQKIQNEKENEVMLPHMEVKEFENKSVFGFDFWKWGVAAAIALLLGIGAFFNPDLFQFQQGKNISQTQTIIKENPLGQKSKVHLPDGTVVYLNADSRISYPAQFSGTRDVVLEGEAFFEVVKDPKRPFTVKSGRLSTTALGTSFNIKSFSKSDQVEVTLVTGKVSVKDKTSKEEILLDPNEQVVVNPNTIHLSKTRVPGHLSTYWKDGIIYFDKTPLTDVITQLERWYGVEFEVEGDIKSLKCSGTFNNEYLTNVLQVLGHTLDFNYSINDKKVEINFNPNPK